MDITKIFKEKSQEALAKIDNLEEFRATDNMVDYIFKIARELFETPLDQQSSDWLVKTGGRLTGAFAYFGQIATRVRAERDIYEQKKEEVVSKMMIDLLDSDYKVTEARAKIKNETGEIDQIIIEKDSEKNRWENILNATDKMVSFVQSAIKVKENERYKSNQYDNH